jgi:hypothetical protein
MCPQLGHFWWADIANSSALEAWPNNSRLQRISFYARNGPEASFAARRVRLDLVYPAIPALDNCSKTMIPQDGRFRLYCL